MLRAVNSSGEPISIFDADEKEQYYCPICGKPLQQRRGQINVHHFAHYASEYSRLGGGACSDRWDYDKSPWHTEWQRRFPAECYEKVLTKDGKKHIADVVVNNAVIEFQHSSISLEAFRERNAFYTSCGYSVIWVFDLTDAYNEDRISFENAGYYRWSHVKNLFRQMDLQNELATVYFQIDDEVSYDDYFTYGPETDDDELLKIERVTNAYQNFTIFYTDTKNAPSITKFVRLAQEDPQKLIPARRKTPPQNQEHAKEGYTVFELWKSEYSGMVVHRNTDGKEMIINGNQEGMFRQNYDPHGRIVGYYCKQGSDGRYHKNSDKEYVVWEAERPIWTLMKAFYRRK